MNETNVKTNSRGEVLKDPPFRIMTMEEAQEKALNQARIAQANSDKQQRWYLVMWVYNDGSGDKGFEFVQGQAHARQLIKNLIDQIDIKQSFIINEVTGFGEAGGKPSVYDFMNATQPLYDDGFDINEYLDSESTDREFEKMQNMAIGDIPETYGNLQADNMLVHYDSEEER
jgi:hypothetical protein